MLEPDKLQSDFPLLQRQINGRPILYLDAATAAPVPRQVIESLASYLERTGTSPVRRLHSLGQEASDELRRSRQQIADFLNAGQEEIIFVRSATEAIHLVAAGLVFPAGSEVIVPEGEHYSNLLPWIVRRNPRAQVIPVGEQGQLDLARLEESITPKTALVAMSLVSHVTGARHPVEEVARMVHAKKALLLVDASQAVARQPIDVGALDCDFLALSGQYLYAPAGVGVLYARRGLLEKMRPPAIGGGTVRRVDGGGRYFVPDDLPHRFEAGTVPGALAVALARAIEYLSSLGWSEIHDHDLACGRRLRSGLASIRGVRVLGPASTDDQVGIVSFACEGVAIGSDTVEVALSDRANVLCASGKLQASPLLARMGANEAVRASVGVYNSADDIDRFLTTLSRIVG